MQGNKVTEHEKDIFDRMMGLPVLRIFGPFFAKHREVLLYLFFGGLAFFLNMALFFITHTKMGIQELVATAVCWVICVLFQYVTNKTWVFRSVAGTTGELIKEIVAFFGGRVFTLIVEEALVFLLITWLGGSIAAALSLSQDTWDLIAKLFAQFVIIVLNYVISKLFVFKNEEEAA